MKKILMAIPKSYQIIGDIILIKNSDKEMAEKIMEKFPRIKTVAEMQRIEGELRKPKIHVIKSRVKKEKTITIHREHGILYKLDVKKVMFSKGNLNERKRLIEKIGKNEIVIDMFAGIGYFSLGIAKRCKKLYAIEKNMDAFNFLKENIELNKIKNIIPINDDNRKVKLEKADRVLMGYLPGTEKFLDAAFGFLKNKGIIHFHNTYNEKELWKKPEEEIKKAGERNGFKIKILEKRQVKSFAPRIYHIVMDIEAEK